ncbi:BREX system Lon protease-like protein BrxL [Mesorhizobium sp.]|uniref:BREX system Lon protease-like protein BrxL n=1 Tax=Mesorhizobium sp. TaxID=1871066 RepID=UPI00257CF463|nr:BREX system Lon protease-like protein BrxL [Mesorhizobium sp.]
MTQEELSEILGLALEGRRRVKEQLKKMGSFEYYQTSFSYTLQETGEEKFVGARTRGTRSNLHGSAFSRDGIHSGRNV